MSGRSRATPRPPPERHAAISIGPLGHLSWKSPKTSCCVSPRRRCPPSPEKIVSNRSRFSCKMRSMRSSIVSKHQEPRDRDRPGGPDAMGAIDRLILDRRIPPAIEQKDVAGQLQIQAHATGPVAHQQHVGVGVLAELPQHAVAPPRGNAAMIGQRTETRQLAHQMLDRANPLTEDNRLAAAAGHLVEIGLDTLEFRAGAGGRIEVANLLQPQHQLENVANRDRLSPFRST